MIKKQVNDILINNYMPYAMSVITSRALPTIDGMKPIHKRILYTMYLMKLYNCRSKSANIVGQTMKLHPHGDMSIYQTLVGLTNDKEGLLIPYVNSKGNFGKHYSSEMQEAAPRYTEAGLNPVYSELFKDIEKNVVNMVDNYDSSLKEPSMLPVSFPTILSNCTLGIAVGMACNICSFNLIELCDYTIKLINDELSIEEVLIPDFTTGENLIYNKKQLRTINSTGKGKIKLRAKYTFNEDTSEINITNIPYTTTIETIIDNITKLAKDNKLKEVLDVVDGSDKDGLSIIIKVKKHTNIKKLMNKLFMLKTKLEDVFSCNFNILVNGTPKVMGVNEILKQWLNFRIECISRGLKFDIDKSSKQLHLLKGLEKILLDIDKTIEIIRKSEVDTETIERLKEYFKIDNAQAEFISNIKLINLNKNYIIRKTNEINLIEKNILEWNNILNSEHEIEQIIINDLERVKKRYGKPRKTEIIYEDNLEDITKADLIEDYSCTIVYTKNYIKKVRRNSDNHKLKDGEIILGEIPTMNKSTTLIFTNKANRYKLNTYDLEDLKPSNLGQYIPNLIDLEENEEIIRIVSVEDEKQGHVVSVFENGKINKTPISKFISKNTKIVNCYNTDSKLIDIDYIKSDVDVFLLSAEGKALITNTNNIPSKASKNSMGTQGIKLDENNKVIGCIINVTPEFNFEIKTKKGRIKEFMLDDIAPTGRPTEERSLFKYLYGRRNNKGNFVIKTRANEDEIVGFKVNR